MKPNTQYNMGNWWTLKGGHDSANSYCVKKKKSALLKKSASSDNSGHFCCFLMTNLWYLKECMKDQIEPKILNQGFNL